MAIIHRESEVIRGSEVSFLSNDEEVYPQLARLYLDFDFRVLSIGSTPQLKYLITYRHLHDIHNTAITPAFNSLPDLEAYANANVIEILQETLFSTPDEVF